MSVSDHSKWFKSEEDWSGGRERGRDREFAGCFILHALISDQNNSKIVDFFVSKCPIIRPFRQNVCQRPLKWFKSEDDWSWERERGQDREFAWLFILLAFISDTNNSKIVDFSYQNAIKFNFSDKMSVGDHSQRLKSEEECSERDRVGKTESLLGASFYMRWYLTRI